MVKVSDAETIEDDLSRGEMQRLSFTFPRQTRSRHNQQNFIVISEDENDVQSSFT